MNFVFDIKEEMKEMTQDQLIIGGVRIVQLLENDETPMIVKFVANEVLGDVVKEINRRKELKEWK